MNIEQQWTQRNSGHRGTVEQWPQRNSGYRGTVGTEEQWAQRNSGHRETVRGTHRETVGIEEQ